MFGISDLMAAITETLVTDDVGEGIEKKSLVTTDSKPESESKPEPESDQMKKLEALFKKLNPEAKEFIPSQKKHYQSLSSDDFAITTKKQSSGEEFNKKDGCKVTKMFD